jgi:hypothetical protein
MSHHVISFRFFCESANQGTVCHSQAVEQPANRFSLKLPPITPQFLNTADSCRSFAIGFAAICNVDGITVLGIKCLKLVFEPTQIVAADDGFLFSLSGISRQGFGQTLPLSTKSVLCSSPQKHNDHQSAK